jgi:methyltransferase
MALNRMMHPRNRYKDSKPDFKKLAEKYDKLRQFADITGKVHLDFKNSECLRALTWCLLKEDFDLDVLLPPDRLIPTIPLRLNYILWLEDLLASTTVTSATPVCGIDIGTGASCVYALLGVRKNNWRFLATEADAVNYEVATKNVERNSLQNCIEGQLCWFSNNNNNFFFNL